jgi:DNA-binding protein H-NS
MKLSELQQLQNDIVKAIKDAKVREKNEALGRIRAIAKEHGMSLEELIGKPQKAGGTVGLPKYKHPENSQKTWTGKGRRPAWVTEHLNAGGSLDELKI